MATHTFTPLLGKRIRATRLDECGRVPAPGTANSFLATNGFVSIKLSSETEDGSEIITRKADGSLCVNEKYSDSFKRFTLEMEFCEVNPSLLEIVSNAIPYNDHRGDVAGFTVPEGDMTEKFSLELWTGLANQACGDGDDEASGYMLLPFVQSGVIGDIEINGEDSVTFTLSGAYTKGGNAWGSGPYHVVYDTSGQASALPTALDPADHLLLLDTGLAPPPSADDPQPMPTATAPTGTGSGSGSGSTSGSPSGSGSSSGTTTP